MRKSFLIAIALALMSACSANVNAQTDAADSSNGFGGVSPLRPLILWIAPEARPAMLFAFAFMQNNPKAPKLYCVSHYHQFTSEKDGKTLVVQIHSIRIAQEPCGDSPFFSLEECRTLTDVDQVSLDESSAPFHLFGCKDSLGRLSFALLLNGRKES